MKKDLRIAGSPIGVLSAEDYIKFIDPEQKRIVYVTNIPHGAGIVELWQSLRSFGEIATIMVPIWNIHVPFYAFITFCREEAAKNAIKHSRSFAIGFKDTFHRVVMEKPIRHINPLNRRQNKDLQGTFMSFQHDDINSKLLIVRAKQGDLNKQKIPVSCSLPVIRRQINSELMYNFVYHRADTDDPTALAKTALPFHAKANREFNDDETFDLATIAHHSIVLVNDVEHFVDDMKEINPSTEDMSGRDLGDTREHLGHIPSNQFIHTLAETRKIKSSVVKVSKNRDTRGIRKTVSFSCHRRVLRGDDVK